MAVKKLSSFDNTIIVNDDDLIEIAKYEDSVYNYTTKSITIDNFRNTLGANSHSIPSHTDSNATGEQLNELVDGSNADSLHSHDLSHDIEENHTDSDATGPQLNTLTDGSDADSLHIHSVNHDIQSHTDTNATGDQLDTLTDGSNSDTLHSHDLDHSIQSHTDTDATGAELTMLVDGSTIDSLHIHNLDDLAGVMASGYETGDVLKLSIDNVMPNWLLCDGSLLSKTIYVDLYEKLKDGGLTCIYGETVDDFYIPDLRGRFIRGAANGSVLDPDRASRTNRGDGTIGDAVGTLQPDEFYSHTHQRRFNSTNWHTTSGGTAALSPGSNNTNTQSKGGNETRPVNINVNYYIKY